MDDEVFEAMWREHYEPVARSAYLVLGDHEEAADVASEAFARAIQRWETVRELERPQAWVYKVAINGALSHRRRLRGPRMLFLPPHRHLAPRAPQR